MDIPVVGDCRNVLNALMNQIRTNSSGAIDLADWYAEPDRRRDSYPLGYSRSSTGALAPERVIEAIGQAAGPEAIYAAGVGQHQMWAAHFITYDKPAPGSTPAASAPWATPSPPPSAPNSAPPTAKSGRSTATAASR